MNDWASLIEREAGKPYYTKRLKPFTEQEYALHTVYPDREKVFRALELTPIQSVKAVILGQDPYHEPGQAQGLAFSVPEGIPIPPSLRNIYEEIDREYGCGIPNSGNLEPWARQGVLLLNTVLTVREHEANSHAGHGWESFTDAVLKELGCQEKPIVFMLWGGKAQKKEALIRSSCHLILKTSHPSPLSVYRGFRGCGHFRACNDFLINNGLKPITWSVV
ncbi:MAG: uracil-DNA glycosylase [Oscillospiraceae bacterium]|nr:uracil-DNA glycosylase [Oscillospiraceae bacterium]